MIFLFKVAQNLAVEHYKRDLDMIFHFKAAQHLVAEYYERGYALFSALWPLKT